MKLGDFREMVVEVGDNTILYLKNAEFDLDIPVSKVTVIQEKDALTGELTTTVVFK